MTEKDVKGVSEVKATTSAARPWAAVWIAGGVVLGPLYAGELEPEPIGGPLYAGFIAGALFSAVAGLASGRRRLADLSPFRAGYCGGLIGAVGGALSCER